MRYLLTEEEFRALGPIKEIEKWKENAMNLSRMLAKRVSRAELQSGIGGYGWGCILDKDAQSEYCSGCVAEPFCPYEFKRWPNGK